jgi:hypothetical protein
MKIDEACINHNVARLVDEMTSALYDIVDDDEDMDHIRIATLGEIRGICQLANALKEVLKT